MQKSIIALLVIFSACAAPHPVTTTVTIPTPQRDSGIVANGKLFTALFQQQAAEYRALCFQAYNMARMKISQQTQAESLDKKPAIVTDIDETLLDNSPVAVAEGLKGNDFNQNAWYEWTSKGMADTVPGAPSFLKYAASRGITIFYITNRDERERAGTLLNLQKFGLPNADNEHLFMRQNTSSKEGRRQQVMVNHEIIMLIGDNLADFSSMFDKKNVEERNSNVSQMASLFGSRFIIIPNPNYGDWENAVYQYNYNLSPAQKDSVIKTVLKAF